jgi:hypothetical protein
MCGLHGAQSEVRVLSDEIVLANPGLVQRTTFAIERRLESILTNDTFETHMFRLA